MDRATQQRHADTFDALHHDDGPLILYNAWDVASAKAIAPSAAAIATSSAGVAASQGYPDGEQVPFAIVTGLIERLVAAVSLPVSVDLEAGYGDTPAAVAASVDSIMRAGAVGINLEDGLAAGVRGLVDPDRQADTIAAARETARRRGLPLFINARTDPFLLRFGTPAECAAEAGRRATIYAAAGADGIFVPGVLDLELIATLAAATALPLNVMMMPGGPPIDELYAAGARRISLGPFAMQAAMNAVGKSAAAVQMTRDTGGIV